MRTKNPAVKSSSSSLFKLKPLMIHYIDMPLSDDICDLKYTKKIKLLKGKVKVWNKHWRYHFSYPSVPGSVTEKAVQYTLMLSRWLCPASWSKDVSIFFFPSEKKHSYLGKRSIMHFIE